MGVASRRDATVCEANIPSFERRGEGVYGSEAFHLHRLCHVNYTRVIASSNTHLQTLSPIDCIHTLTASSDATKISISDEREKVRKRKLK